MAKRVSQVAAGALESYIRVNLENLRSEQVIRSQPIDHNLGRPSPPTDWSLVIAAVRSMEASEA